MPDANGYAPGFYHLALAPEGAERIVLRFPDADVSAISSDDGALAADIELRGKPDEVAAWQPSVRRIEGILILGEEQGAVKVSEFRLRLPSSIRDLEIHGCSGDIEVRNLPIGVIVETQTGRIKAVGPASLEAKSAEGEIEAEATGHAELSTKSGKIRSVRPSGRMTAHSESGDVEVEDSAADIFVETGSGEILVTRPRGRLRIQSDAGDIEIEAPESFGGGEANTTTGHIALSLSGASVELRAETLSGKLRTPQGVVGNNQGPRRAALSVAGGGRRLHAKSVSGDIEIDY